MFSLLQIDKLFAKYIVLNQVSFYVNNHPQKYKWKLLQ